MDEYILKYLQDVLDAINDVEYFSQIIQTDLIFCQGQIKDMRGGA